MSWGGGGFKGEENFNQNNNNGAIHTLSQISKYVMETDSEGEWEDLFITAREYILVITTLKEMGHSQLSIPMQVDNPTSDGIMD